MVGERLHYFGAPEPLLTTRGLRNLSDKSCLSIAKAQRDLGYRVRYQRANGIPRLLVAAQQFYGWLEENDTAQNHLLALRAAAAKA